MRVIFDVHNVLTPVNPWQAIHARHGITPEQDQELIDQYTNGSDDYGKWIRNVVGLWVGAGATRNSISDSALNCFPMQPEGEDSLVVNVRKTMNELKKSGHKLHIVSTTPDAVLARIGSFLGLEGKTASSNQLLFDYRSKLNDVKIEYHDEGLARLHKAMNILAGQSDDLSQIAYVGAGSGCMAVMRSVGLSIAPEGSVVAEIATETYQTLDQVPEIISERTR